MAPARALLNYLNLRWFLALIAFIACLLLLPHFGVLREDLQTLLFPLMLITVLKVPKAELLRFPRWVFFVAAVCWALGALHVRAYAPSIINGHGIYISRLDEGSQSLLHRELYRRVNEISKRLDLPPAYLVQQRFESDDPARSWLRSHPEALFVARGTNDWIRLVFNPLRSIAAGAADPSPDFLRSAAERAGIGDVDQFAHARVEWIEEPFLVGQLPEFLLVPGQPPELGRHFLSWLGKGLLDEKHLERYLPNNLTDSQRRERLVAERKAALLAAGGIEGLWKSSAPRGTALSLAATLELLDAVRPGEPVEERGLHCAQVGFRNSAALARHDDVPQIAAITFNNIAVARIFAGYRDSDFVKAYKWLSIAAGLRGKDGEPTLGAKLALVNLEMLWRSGLLSPEMLR